MYNIFDVLPDSFFYVFYGGNKRIMSDCLYLVFQSFHNDLSFSTTKEEIISKFQDYFENHITTIETDDVLNTSREKALYILKRLKECGWVNEETGENYEVFITFEDYAVKVLENLFSLDHEDDAEYSGIIFNIYNAFINFDINRGDLVFESGYKNTKELANRLKNLNSNIKKYIQNLLKEGIKDDLEALLTSLLDDYQTKIIDRAYYNLTTYDNPSKYRQRIINSIENIMSNEENTDRIIRNIMERKDIDYPKAYDILLEQSEYIINSFEHIEDIMQEIDDKNNKFVESAINRITFLLNNRRDVEGKINNIIKGVSVANDISDIGNIYINQLANKDSLFVPRTFSKPIQITMDNEMVLDEKEKNEIVKKIKQSEQYSQKYIQKKVMNKLKEDGEFLGSSLPINNNDDLATLVLVYLYGYSYASQYAIEPLDKIVQTNNYRFREFKVKEKING